MDAGAWDDRYAGEGLVWHAEPNRFVAEALADRAPGTALDVACGEGRNAAWLAERGWAATGVDFSPVGLAKAARLATERGVAVQLIEADVTSWTPPAVGFDVVVVAYLQLPPAQRGEALRRAMAAVAPSGELLVVAHDARNLTEGVGGPQDPAVLYGPDDVLADLDACDAADLRVVQAEVVERPVVTDGGPRVALDCLVRVRRVGPDGEGR